MPTNSLRNLHIFTSLIKNKMNTIHQIVIKYLTYLVFNKRNLIINKNQYPLSSHSKWISKYCFILFIYLYFYKQESTYRKVGSEPHHTSRGFLSKVGPTCSNSRRNAWRWFFFSFLLLPTNLQQSSSRENNILSPWLPIATFQRPWNFHTILDVEGKSSQHYQHVVMKNYLCADTNST